MKRIVLAGALLVFMCAFNLKATAQLVMSPTDNVVVFNWNTKPSTPWGKQIFKWGRMPNKDIKWDTTGIFKSYFYDGIPFRIHFPKTYTASADGKKYPLILFWHGGGEAGMNDLLRDGSGKPIKDSKGNNISVYPWGNSFQMIHGHINKFHPAIQNGIYDGFVISPQVDEKIWGSHIDRMVELIKIMIRDYKVDPFRIIVNGLSDGGKATWETADMYPNFFSSIIPMSWSNPGYTQASWIQKLKYLPIWFSQGGTDINPLPQTAFDVEAAYKAAGANLKLQYYPTNGHWTWNDMWDNPNFWPTVNNAYASNPWPLFDRRTFWPGEPISTTIGLTPGFEGYEWRRNGVPIVGANSNEIYVTGTGVYDARVKRSDELPDGTILQYWSDWSHVPVKIIGNDIRIQAEDYVAMFGINTEPTSDVDGNLNVGWVNKGDWMDYTIKPYKAGIYTIKFRVAATEANGTFEIRKSDSTVLKTVTVPKTGGWQIWQTIAVDVPLTAGTQNIRIKYTGNPGFNLNWLEFSADIAPAPLPVNFTFFNAACNGAGVDLLWKTAQEQNSKYFAVQKSTDGTKWSTIATVPAAGQSTTERSYRYTDKNAAASSLYRIAEFDVDGKTTLTAIVKSNCGSKDQLLLYPNPATGDATLSVMLQRPAKVSYWVYDNKGALMFQGLQMLPAGTTALPLATGNFAKGVYTIKVNYNAEVKSLQLVKR